MVRALALAFVLGGAVPEFNLIQRPDLILRLQQMLGIRQAHITPSLAETVVPVVVFGDVRDTGGDRQIVRKAWGSVDLLPTVGTFGHVALGNPVTSRTIVTVRHIRMHNPIAASTNDRRWSMGLVGPNFTGLPTLIGNQFKQFRHTRAVDLRSDGSVLLPVAQITVDTNGALTNRAYRWEQFTTEALETELEVVLLPGWGLQMTCNANGATNNEAFVALAWDEEDLEQRQ